MGRGLEGRRTSTRYMYMHQPAVVPDLAVTDDGIADRQLAHLSATGRIDRMAARRRADNGAWRNYTPACPIGGNGLGRSKELLREGAAGVGARVR